MSIDVKSVKPRKPRADAQRNRALLLDTAKQVFAQKGTDASMDAIAQAAGLGPGTLYRHFPNRDALIEAVYRNESQQLADAAERLAGSKPPVEALRSWMLLFVDYMATKQLMAAAMAALPSGTSALYAASGAQVKATIDTLTRNAAASGELKLTLAPLELLRAVAAVSSAGGDAAQLVDILIAGMRA